MEIIITNNNNAYNGGLCMNAVTCKGRYELHNRTTET